VASLFHVFDGVIVRLAGGARNKKTARPQVEAVPLGRRREFQGIADCGFLIAD
jgi:hypothetical protein